jgi:putative membrane protein (TIGR04086 family)
MGSLSVEHETSWCVRSASARVEATPPPQSISHVNKQHVRTSSDRYSFSVAVTDSLDLDAVRKGVIVAAVIAVPVALLSIAVRPDDRPGQNRGAVAFFTVLVLGALVAGASIAARRQQRGTPFLHGIVASAIVVVVLALIRVVRRATQGHGPGLSVMSNLLLGIVCGIVGGLIGGRRGKSAGRSPASDP